MMMTKMHLLTLLPLIAQCLAFSPLSTQSLRRSPLSLSNQGFRRQSFLSRSKNDDDGGKDSNERNRRSETISSRTDINHFLTQRTIQSFMILLKHMRDPHTGAWIEDFLGSPNLLSYHGTGAICTKTFPTWDSLLREMISRDADVVIIEIEASNAGRGLSKNNPFRDNEDNVIEIELDIDPPAIAGRLLSVREKLASEFVQDLDLLIVANKEILPSYHQRCLEARKDEECSTETKGGDKEEGDDYEDYKKRCESKDPNVGSVGGDFNFGQRTVQSFERASIYMINNHPNFNDPNSSLLRATSFDLLSLLSAQESMHRVIQSYKEEGDEKENSFHWLLEYYNKSLDEYFDGDQTFGRADDFLDDLLSTPPSLKTINGKVGFIDPLLIAEDIINAREEVVEEWKDTVSSATEDHEGLRQAAFLKRMEGWGHKPLGIEDKVESKNEETEVDDKKVKNWIKSKKKEKTFVLMADDGQELFGEFE